MTAMTAPTVVHLLTPREREVLCGIRDGWTYGAIARSLGVSESRVTQIACHLREKANVSTNAQLMWWAFCRGLLAA